MKLRSLFLAAALLAPFALQAQTSTWTIDPAHSQANFQVKHLGVSTVRGSIAGIKGEVLLDEKNITKSSVNATLDANTVDTGVAARDADLKSDTFFNVAKFPTIGFKFGSLSKSNGKLYLMGDLTIAGVTKPVTLEVDGPAAPVTNPMSKVLTSGFSATGVISRKDFNFGQKYGEAMLSDAVKFTLDIEIDKK